MSVGDLHTAAGRGRHLRARRLGVSSFPEAAVYLRADNPVCQFEGFEANARIEVSYLGHRVAATLNIVHSAFIAVDELAVSEAVWLALDAVPGAHLDLMHQALVPSFSHVRSKIYGHHITQAMAEEVLGDVLKGRYSDIEMAALITAFAGTRLDVAETVALTRAMVEVGETINWDAPVVVDKHCVGGLAGNRTTLIVVPIVAACGLLIPKTSSRAITSPAGTADTMETLAPVELSISQMRKVVEQEHGCVVWGGAVSLSPADDLLIHVERPLDLDSSGLMVASILSKKIAAGSNHIVIDIPVGHAAKIRSPDAARALVSRLQEAAHHLGITIKTVISDGSQPVGRGIGPALEARDVLAVLQNDAHAPKDLRERGLQLAASVLEMAGKAVRGKGLELAGEVLGSGRAWNKFQAICEAQGGMRTPPIAPYTHQLLATHKGEVVAVDNRKLAKAAKLAGAPDAPAAGISYLAPIGAQVEVGQPLLTIHAESQGQLEFARAYAEQEDNLFLIQNE